jgi:hypothetical protein
MKNKYVKPTVSVELFCPAQSIARDCADSIPRSQLTYADINACRWDLGGGASVFVTPQPCTIDGEGMGVACYNNPSESKFIFRS